MPQQCAMAQVENHWSGALITSLKILPVSLPSRLLLYVSSKTDLRKFQFSMYHVTISTEQNISVENHP